MSSDCVTVLQMPYFIAAFYPQRLNPPNPKKDAEQCHRKVKRKIQDKFLPGNTAARGRLAGAKRAECRMTWMSLAARLAARRRTTTLLAKDRRDLGPARAQSRAKAAPNSRVRKRPVRRTRAVATGRAPEARLAAGTHALAVRAASGVSSGAHGALSERPCFLAHLRPQPARTSRC